MKHLILGVATVLLMACNATSQKPPLTIKKTLGPHLKEISGITVARGVLYAITDKPHAQFFAIDTASGNVAKTVQINNVTAVDVESITSDNNYLYIGDTGDNDGTRTARQIFKVPIPANDTAKEINVNAEVITFSFPDEGTVDNKKDNNYDCEAILSLADSIYIFTKDREDKETKEYIIPNKAGTYTARFINIFKSKGLITDAAINTANNEVALIGYHKGHHYPFIILLDGFKGNDFFSGNNKRIELADKDWDWQLESICYDKNGVVYFANEGTDAVPATLYGIRRNDIMSLKKDGKPKSKSKDKDDAPHLTLKGHLK